MKLGLHLHSPLLTGHRGLHGLKSDDSADADSAFLSGSAVSIPSRAAPAGAV